jgi:hypothetical protein
MLNAAPLKMIVLVVAVVALGACSESPTSIVEPTRSPDQVKSRLAAWLLELDTKIAELDSTTVRYLSVYVTGEWVVERRDPGAWNVTTAYGVYTV